MDPLPLAVGEKRTESCKVCQNKQNLWELFLFVLCLCPYDSGVGLQEQTRGGRHRDSTAGCWAAWRCGWSLLSAHKHDHGFGE